jgi:hypothetical protein
VGRSGEQRGAPIGIAEEVIADPAPEPSIDLMGGIVIDQPDNSTLGASETPSWTAFPRTTDSTPNCAATRKFGGLPEMPGPWRYGFDLADRSMMTRLGGIKCRS